MADSLSVRELCEIISAAVSGAFGNEVWVRGTISGIKRHPSGAVYFDLVDESDQLGTATKAVMSVALFEQDRYRVNNILRKAAAQGVRMTDGMEILIRGAVKYYARSGRVQLVMSLIDPSYTIGKIEIAKAALVSDLKKEGLWDKNKSKQLDVAPLCVALITSSNSAAEADFVDELRSSGFPFEIHLFDTRVQGDGAVSSLQSSLTAVSKSKIRFNSVAIVRGGGARADLVAFDHGDVVRAIANCDVPVLVGVGHDIDRSIADDVAHTSVKTPTACAAFLVGQVQNFSNRIESAAQRLGNLGRLTLRAENTRLTNIHQRLALAPINRLNAENHRLTNFEVRARALDPALALARGWSITRRADGSPLTSVSDLKSGEELVTSLADGQVRSTISNVESQPPTVEEIPEPPTAK